MYKSSFKLERNVYRVELRKTIIYCIKNFSISKMHFGRT